MDWLDGVIAGPKVKSLVRHLWTSRGGISHVLEIQVSRKFCFSDVEFLFLLMDTVCLTFRRAIRTDYYVRQQQTNALCYSVASPDWNSDRRSPVWISGHRRERTPVAAADNSTDCSRFHRFDSVASSHSYRSRTFSCRSGAIACVNPNR